MTNSAGEFMFRDINVGPGYVIAVEKSGFRLVRSAPVEVREKQNAIVDFSLTAGTAEVPQGRVEVAAEAQDVDAKITHVGAKTGEALYKRVPVQRNVSAVTSMSPGVSDSVSSGPENPSISGATGFENRYEIGSANVTDPGRGTFSIHSRVPNSPGRGVDFESVQEVQAQTAGMDAKHGQALGGIVSTVVKTGGNLYHGSFYGYWNPRALSAGWKHEPFQTNLTSRLEANERIDVGGELGGFLLRNHIFWHAGLNPVFGRQYWTAPSTFANNSLFGRYNSKSMAWNYQGRMTFNVHPQHQLEGTIFGDPSDTPIGFSRPDALAANDDSRASGFNYGSRTWTARYNGAARGFTWTLQYSDYFNEFRETPRYPDRFNILDLTGTQAGGIGGMMSTGGLGFMPQTESRNHQFTAANINRGNLGGLHEIEWGYQFERGYYDEVNRYSGSLFTLPNNTAFGLFAGQAFLGGTFVRTRLSPSDPNSPFALQLTGAGLVNPNTTSDNKYHAGFIQDTWNISRYFGIKAGLRYEYQRIEGNGMHHTFIDWAPRVGFVIDPTGNRNAKFFAHWGKFYEKLPLALVTRAFWNQPALLGARFANQTTLNANTLTPVSTNNVVLSGTPDFRPFVASGTEVPRQDEIVFGYEQEFMPGFTFSGRGIYRHLRRPVALVSGVSAAQALAGVPVHYVLANPSPNLDLFGTASPCIRGTAGCDLRTGFTAGGVPIGGNGTPEGFPNPSRVYRAVELVLQKRFSSAWQLYTHYRLSKLHGTWHGPFLDDGMTFNPMFDFTTSGAGDTFSGFHQAGFLPNDRRHVVRFFNTYRASAGFMNNWNFGFGVNLQSGTPISRFNAHPVTGMPGVIPVGERGSLGRTRLTYPVDVHADYTLRFTEQLNFKFVADFFNILNQRRALFVNQNAQLFGGTANSDFLQPNLSSWMYPYQTPFHVRLALRLEF